MEGSIGFLYAAVGVTLAAIVGYLLFLNGRLAGLQRERDTLEHGDGWPGGGDGHAEAGRPA